MEITLTYKKYPTVCVNFRGDANACEFNYQDCSVREAVGRFCDDTDARDLDIIEARFDDGKLRVFQVHIPEPEVSLRDVTSDYDQEGNEL